MKKNSKEAVSFLMDKLALENQELLSDVKEGVAIIRDEYPYVNKAIKVGSNGIIRLVETQQDADVGVTSFEKGRTKKGQAIAFLGARVSFAGAGAANDVEVKDKVYTPYTLNFDGTQRIPAAILNSDLVVSVGNMEIARTPVKEMVLQGRESGDNQGQFAPFSAPKFIGDQEPIKVMLEMPEGVSLAGTADTAVFVQVSFDAIGTVSKI